MDDYTYPVGQTIIKLMLIFTNIVLISYMIALFVISYTKSWTNMEAYKRMNVVELKRSRSYHPYYGSIT